MDLLNEVIANYQLLDSHKDLTDVGMRMPTLRGSKQAEAKQLAYQLFNILKNENVTEESPVEKRQHAYIHYTKLKASIKKLYILQAQAKNEANKKPKSCKLTPFHQARYNVDVYKNAKSLGLSEQITNPTAMPVEVSTYDELKEFFARLADPTEAKAIKADDIGAYEQFNRGAYYTDGRIDLCKQVVGPDHIEKLMNSFRMNPHIKHFLLGNNIIGLTGAKAIADFILDPIKKSNIQTWYIAGNAIDSSGATLIANALANDAYCKDLWLKRNPIGIEGAKALAKMLETNTSIETLDLDNTAIMDEGCIALFKSLEKNTTLKSIYLDANGLTVKSAEAIADYICFKSNSNTPGITHLSLSMNRLEDAGATLIADALNSTGYPIECLVLGGNRIELAGLKSILAFASESKSLTVLDIGYYKATADMGELPNSYGDVGARHLAAFIMLNTPLRYLGFHNTHITDLSPILAAMEFNTNLYMLSPEQFQLSCAKLYDYCLRNSKLPLKEHKELVRKLKHGKNIWVIDSIYRNADFD